MTDLRFALRSLSRVKGLAITVILTLALGIGANAAIFSVVRGVLLRPLVNRDEDRLIYIRQSAKGIGADNATFSVPEIHDLRGARQDAERVRRLLAPSTFTMIGLGEPRVVRAGVVGGSYFDVMGLRPVLGRLLDATDDGPQAAGAAVLTHRFWTTTLDSDPSVIGKTIRLGDRTATIVGVLEPSVPYPAETEIIANVVTSPHHLSATMDGRARASDDGALRAAGARRRRSTRRAPSCARRTARCCRSIPEAYPKKGDFRIDAVQLRDQITSSARTVLLVLLAASALVFVIACSNVANLILARSVRREGELAIRAALGASAARCGARCWPRACCCAAPARSSASPSRGRWSRSWRAMPRASRCARSTSPSTRACCGSASGWRVAAAILLAFVPRLPSSDAANGLGLSSGSVRITSGTNRRLRLFAVTQIAASFVLLAGAGMLLTTLIALQRAQTGFETRQRPRGERAGHLVRADAGQSSRVSTRT